MSLGARKTSRSAAQERARRGHQWPSVGSGLGAGGGRGWEGAAGPAGGAGRQRDWPRGVTMPSHTGLHWSAIPDHQGVVGLRSGES